MCQACGGKGYIRIVTWVAYGTGDLTPPREAPVQIVACRCREWWKPVQ